MSCRREAACTRLWRRPGGFTEEAAAEALNLAEKITDGMKITVYDREEARTLEASGTSEGGGPGSQRACEP